MDTECLVAAKAALVAPNKLVSARREDTSMLGPVLRARWGWTGPYTGVVWPNWVTRGWYFCSKRVLRGAASLASIAATRGLASDPEEASPSGLSREVQLAAEGASLLAEGRSAKGPQACL